ncbi:MAG: HEAT repeat domain-containing protein [Geobacteraceae bacterium]|nr:HEAT repeat domain-containing protein [Geobacteraceae bacterium]
MNSASMPADTRAELQQAATFAADLIVCRSHIQFYPDSHPAVSTILKKTIQRLEPFLADGKPLTLGVTRQGLLLNEALIEPNNVKFREYAALLASLGIIAISFTPEIQPEDLLEFNRIINRQRSEIWESGGIIHAFDISGVRAIMVQAIDPSVFTLTDDIQDANGDTWEFFVRKLLKGCFNSSPDKMRELISSSPSRLACELADMLEGMPEDGRSYTLKALAECYVGRSLSRKADMISDDSLDKIIAFISGLDPKVRCDFILNICNSSHATTEFNERLLNQLPEDGLQEVVQAVTAQGAHVPDMLLNLVQRLAAHSESCADTDAALVGSGVEGKVQTLMRERDLEQYIPPGYLQTLMTILATDRLPDAESNFLEELRATMETKHLESKLTDIIDEIVLAIPPEKQGAGIRNSLEKQLNYFLEIQDFKSLAKVCRILGSANPGSDDALFNSDFVQRILKSAATLGRDSFAGIREVITTVGSPFIEPLIDKLAMEENRSLRRFWFDCLGGMGEMVRNAALLRLNDEQWFVIRNLLVMLRNFSDPEVVQKVRKLTEYPHPKVRSEALKNLLHYRDPAADKMILTELQHPDPARKLAAVQVAEMSRDKDVMQQLLNLLETSGIADFQLELKSAAVQALANIGNPSTLPKLLNIISSAPLLHRNKHSLLKIEVVRALPRFRAEYVRPILQKIAGMPEDPLALHAAEALKILDGVMP